MKKTLFIVAMILLITLASNMLVFAENLPAKYLVIGNTAISYDFAFESQNKLSEILMKYFIEENGTVDGLFIKLDNFFLDVYGNFLSPSQSEEIVENINILVNEANQDGIVLGPDDFDDFIVVDIY